MLRKNFVCVGIVSSLTPLNCMRDDTMHNKARS
jgi:hypothetical protein